MIRTQYMAQEPKKYKGNYARPFRKGEKKKKMTSNQRAGMTIFLVVGGLIGYSANQLVETTFGKTTRDINELALQAHEVYGSQEFHAIELEAIDQPAIENWFNNSIKIGFKVPNLQAFDFEFKGARLTTAEGKPAAYLLYINDDDQQIAYYMARSKSNTEGATQTPKWNLSTWHQGNYGYVLIGKVPPTKLQQISTSLQNK